MRAQVRRQKQLEQCVLFGLKNKLRFSNVVNFRGEDGGGRNYGHPRVRFH